MNKYIINKKGNVFIPIGLVILVIIFVTVFLMYYQVNIIIENVRRDLFYASNNAILSFDIKDLAYRKYTVDKEQTKQIIEYILNKNYADSDITKVQVTNLEILNEQNKIHLKIQVQVTFKSVINIAGKSEHDFKMNENIKISLMDYK